MSDEEYLEDLEMLGPRSGRHRFRRRRRLPVRPARSRPPVVDMGEETVRARPSVDMEPMRVEGRRGRATRLNQAQAVRRQGEEKDRRGRARDLLRSLRRRY